MERGRIILKNMYFVSWNEYVCYRSIYTHRETFSFKKKKKWKSSIPLQANFEMQGLNWIILKTTSTEMHILLKILKIPGGCSPPSSQEFGFIQVVLTLHLHASLHVWLCKYTYSRNYTCDSFFQLNKFEF